MKQHAHNSAFALALDRDCVPILIFFNLQQQIDLHYGFLINATTTSVKKKRLEFFENSKNATVNSVIIFGKMVVVEVLFGVRVSC